MDTSTSRNICYFLIITYLVNSDYSRAMGFPQREEPRCNSQFEYEYKVIQKLVELETSQKDFQEIIKKQEETLRKRDETITALEADIQSLSDKLNDVDRKLQEGETKINGVNQNFEIVQMLKNITGSHVGFTVKYPKDNTNPRIFQTVVYNSEPGFNTATGKFVCQYSGMYLFTTTVMRNVGSVAAQCSISVNGANKITAHAINHNPKAITLAYPSASVTLVVHLKTRDEVYLADCSAKYIQSESIFSGVLIRPDVG